MTTIAQPLSAGKIVTEVSLARSLSAFSSLYVMFLCVGGRQLLIADVTEALIRSLSAAGRRSMPDSNEDTIKGVGKLFGVMAKLKLKLRAECSVVVKVLSEMFMTLFLEVVLTGLQLGTWQDVLEFPFVTRSSSLCFPLRSLLNGVEKSVE